MTAVQLLTVADLGRAGWDTSALGTRTQVREGAVPTGVCQRDPLLTFPGAGTRVRVDLAGRWTSAHEVAATFASGPQATAAYDALRAGFDACRAGTWSPPDGRVAVGPEIPVADRGVWSTVVPAGAATARTTATTSALCPGAMGVLRVGQRVAVVQVDDPAPRRTTVAAIMAAAADRLAR